MRTNPLENFHFYSSHENTLIVCFIAFSTAKPVPTFAENALEIREQCAKQLKELQEAYGEAMLELRVRKKFRPSHRQALMEREDDI